MIARQSHGRCWHAVAGRAIGCGRREGAAAADLQDLFVDAHVPQALRDAWPIVATPAAIVWVPGLRAAAGFLATPESQTIIKIRIARDT